MTKKKPFFEKKKYLESAVPIEKLRAAGVTWEDLHDRAKADRKLAEYDKRMTVKKVKEDQKARKRYGA
jgi:hypothetical protein